MSKGVNVLMNIASKTRKMPSFQKCSLEMIEFFFSDISDDVSDISRIPPIHVNKIPIVTRIIESSFFIYIYTVNIKYF